MPTISSITNALKHIIDPDFNKDIVSLGFVQNISISGGDVSFDIALTTPACPVKEQFRSQAEESVRKLPGVKSVKINMTTLKRKAVASHPPGVSNLENVREIIAVSSCKGGVGKSTVAAHMAQELARRGHKVGLLDADIHGPSVPTLFDLPLEQIRVNTAKQLIPVEKNGLKIMSFGFLLGDGPAIYRGPIVTRYLQQILLTTDWGELDYLFIDMPPGTGDVQLTITQTVRLNGAVIITTPQTLSLVDVTRGILMFERVKVPILGIVENMAFLECDGCGKKHEIFGPSSSQLLADRFGVGVVGQLPILKQMTLSIGKPLANEFIMSCVDKTIMALGRTHLTETQIPEIHFNRDQVTLTWDNKEEWVIPNKVLRLSCRCAYCADERTGEILLKPSDVPDDIAPLEITPLGNYAIGIRWSDGHASGIYPYASIKTLIKS